MFKHTPLATLCGALAAGVLAANTAQAAAIFTTNFAAFNAANAGLVVEDFENAVVASGSDTAFAGPLNSSTANGIFAAGSVAPGFSLAPTSGDVYVSRDRGGNSGANVSANLYVADMNITFGAGVTAIGIDLMQWFGNNGDWLVEAFDAANVSMGGVITTGGTFVGITATSDIARLFLDKPNSGAVIDNLRFGAAGGTVPEPSTLLLLAAAGLGLIAASRRRPPARACRS